MKEYGQTFTNGLACSRLQEKSFSKKKCAKRAGAGERHHRPLSKVARVLFALCLF